MDNKHKVEKVLENIRVRNLSVEEKENAWHGVVSKIAEMPAPQEHNWSLNKSIKKSMLSIFAVIAVLVLGVSGTVVASNGAKPGDALFGVDRAVEDIRINIAGDDKKDDLRIAFAEERVRELEDIIKTEDDGSTDDSEGRSKRVAVGIEAATSFLESVSAQIALSADTEKAARIEALIKQLSDELGSLSGEIKIELQNEETLRVRFQDNNSGSGNSEDNGNGRIEVKSDDGKLKIEMKDGELRIKSDLFDDDSDDDSDDDNSNSTSSNSSSGGFEAEADVFTDKTVVKVEINDTKTVFTTLSKTRDAVVADILAKFPSLSKAQIEATLEIEIENRASEADDMNNSTSSDNGSDDDSNNDSSDDDSSDDDSDDDNGGSNDDDDDSDDDNGGSGSGNSGGSNN